MGRSAREGGGGAGVGRAVGGRWVSVESRSGRQPCVELATLAACHWHCGAGPQSEIIHKKQHRKPKRVDDRNEPNQWIPRKGKHPEPTHIYRTPYFIASHSDSEVGELGHVWLVWDVAHTQNALR